MDYLHPIEALIPGARGLVLATLTRNTTSRTIRQVSVDAGVSWSRTSEVIADLADLGLVERRQTPGGVLVRLLPQNVAARAIGQMNELHGAAVEAMQHAAKTVRPAPVNLTLFGSFARGMAGRDSDVDVVAVTPGASGPELARWEDSLGHWVDSATAITGNPVKLIEVGVDELRKASRRTPAWLRQASAQGIVLAGKPLGELTATATPGRRRA